MLLDNLITGHFYVADSKLKLWSLPHNTINKEQAKMKMEAHIVTWVFYFSILWICILLEEWELPLARGFPSWRIQAISNNSLCFFNEWAWCTFPDSKFRSDFPIPSRAICQKKLEVPTSLDFFLKKASLLMTSQRDLDTFGLYPDTWSAAKIAIRFF